MRTGFIGLAAFVAAASLGGAANAAGDDTNADVRCIVVALALSQSQDDQVRSVAPAALMYFRGRIEGRSPNFDLEPAIIAAVQTMSPSSFAAESARCGGQLEIEGRTLKAIGEDLKAKADATKPPAG